MSKKLPSYICRKSENSETWKCICGNCRAENLEREVAAWKSRFEELKESRIALRLSELEDLRGQVRSKAVITEMVPGLHKEIERLRDSLRWYLEYEWPEMSCPRMDAHDSLSCLKCHPKAVAQAALAGAR